MGKSLTKERRQHPVWRSGNFTSSRFLNETLIKILRDGYGHFTKRDSLGGGRIGIGFYLFHAKLPHTKDFFARFIPAKLQKISVGDLYE